MKLNENDKSSWAVGGMTLIGVGVGLIFVQTNPIMMAASILIGIGIGLVISSVLSKK